MAAFTHAINQKNKAKAGASATTTAEAPRQKMRVKDRPLANCCFEAKTHSKARSPKAYDRLREVRALT